MSSEQEPEHQPADLQHEPDSSDVLTLVDLFDQMDRAAFQRALDSRDNTLHTTWKR
jgi:hypothetical protein